MRTTVVGVTGLLLLFAGCSDQRREEDLMAKLAQAQKDRESFQQQLGERDRHIEQVMDEINGIYTELEQARIKEGKLVQRSREAGGVAESGEIDTREKFLSSIKDIGNDLRENRKRIADLQSRLKKNQVELAGLNKLVENLKVTIEEREQSIARLEAKVQGLEVTLLEKDRMIWDRDTTIENQKRSMNVAYLTTGQREQLEERGIIRDEGGFLWGLLGSTTVMASGVDVKEFTPLDRSREQTILIPGKVEEILPYRNPELFTMSEVGEKGSELKILNPEKFWQDKYLVVIVD